MLDFIKNISPLEIGIIIFILLLFFGGKIITGLAKNAGETLKEVKKVKRSFTDAFDDKPAKAEKES